MTEPAWLLDLEPASFKGVAFKVRTHSRTGGKRGPDNEYPQRDVPSPEDLGRLANRFTIEAFVIGDDYHQQAAQLIQALESGVGELTHPRWGPLQVLCRSYTESEDMAEQGLGSFSLSFIEDPGVAGIIITVSGEDAVDEDALAVKVAAKKAFVVNFSTNGFGGGVVDRALASLFGRVNAMQTAINSPIAGVLDDFDKVITLAQAILINALALVQTPGDLADALVELVEAIADLGSLVALTADRPASLTFGATPPTDPSEAQILANTDTLVDLVQRAALAELARQAVVAGFVVFDDAVELRDLVDDRLRVEEALDVTITEYEALVGTRVELVIDLTSKAESLVRLREITVLAMTSTLELAWSLYGDAERADEIGDRNKIVHGGFVPPGVYRVLAE